MTEDPSAQRAVRAQHCPATAVGLIQFIEADPTELDRGPIVALNEPGVDPTSDSNHPELAEPVG